MSDERGDGPGGPRSAMPRAAVRLTDPGQRQPIPVSLQPDAGARRAVAAHLGIPAVRKLRLEGRLTPQDRQDWRLDADLGATVVQDCVVTLAPVTTRIDERVERAYVADLALPEAGPGAGLGAGEVEMPDDAVEPLPQTLDLFAVMVEALALALPPYPRAEGAELGAVTVTEPGAVPLTEEAARPFARLRDALKGDG